MMCSCEARDYGRFPAHIIGFVSDNLDGLPSLPLIVADAPSMPNSGRDTIDRQCFLTNRRTSNRRYYCTDTNSERTLSPSDRPSINLHVHVMITSTSSPAKLAVCSLRCTRPLLYPSQHRDSYCRNYMTLFLSPVVTRAICENLPVCSWVVAAFSSLRYLCLLSFL